MSQVGAYNIDICLCIDKTGSMRPIINTVKNNALNLHRDICNALEVKGKHVQRLRIRVIWFGDYLADKEPMLLSDFLTLPDQVGQFESFVNGVSASGGGDVPEDSLEALAYAMRSSWCTDGWKKRHIIAMFSDAPPHTLGHGKASPNYPHNGMPSTFSELSQMWGDLDNPGEMDPSAKRLLLFTPDEGAWHTIKDCWENTVHNNANAAMGLEDISYHVMLNTIGNSV